MAASYGAGGQSPPVIGRPVERVFEDAQFTGEVNLSGRKLKDYPKICTKYDLADTIHADLSKNRLSDLPPEVCEYSNMERLNCYHNVIKSIPEAIVQLQALTHLNLSRNQLSVLPVSLCAMSSLEVLLASNNKLVSLPEEIGKLERLMDLDVSCNEISHLPPQIGDLRSLRSLNLRRNLLVELPLDICKLNLRKLDISSNRIQKIPTVFRKLEVLEEMILEHNPLQSPPAHICTRGRQHIMKYLQTEAIKEDRKRGILSDADMKRLVRKSLPPQQTSDEFRSILEAPEGKWKRHTVLSSDSGYSTADSLDKCGWNQSESLVMGEVDENNVLAIKAAEAVREQRQSHSNGNANIPSDIARTRLHPAPASPSLSNRSASPLPAPSGSSLGINSNNGAAPCSPTAASADFSQVTLMVKTPPSPLPPRGHSNHHAHHLNHQPFYQRLQQQQQHQKPYQAQQQPENCSSLQHPSHSQSHLHPSHLHPGPALSHTHLPQPHLSHYHSHAPQPLSLSSQQVGGASDYRTSSSPLLTSYQQVLSPCSLGEDFPPPPAPLAHLEDEDLTPPMTPPTPLAQHQVMSITGSLEDEFARELQRQKQEYEQRKKAAEQIRLAHEEKEREERRRTALKIQEEQQMMMERQREEQARREAERQREEQARKEAELQREQAWREAEQKREEQAWREAEQRREEEQARLLLEQERQENEARLRDRELHGVEEERGGLEALQQDQMHKHTSTNNSLIGQHAPPPWGQPMHGSPRDGSLVQHGCDCSTGHCQHDLHHCGHDWHVNGDGTDSVAGYYSQCDDSSLSEWEYRNALSSQSFKEQRRIANATYRRTASDTVTPKRGGIPTAVTTGSHGDHNHIIKNGVAEDDLSPSTHPPKLAASPTSPNHNPSLCRLQAGGERVPSQNQSPATRRGKAGDQRSNVPTPTSGRSVSRTSSTSSVNSVQSQGSTGNSRPPGVSSSATTVNNNANSARSKNHLTPEEEFRQRQLKTQQQADAQRLKSRLEEPRSKGTLQNTAMGAKRPGTAEANSDNKRQSGGGRAGALTGSKSNPRPDHQTRLHLSNGRTSGLPTGKQALGGVKMVDEYRDANPNLTIRRREEVQREENQQLEMLRQTIESRLKVTLPDNLPEALRDGVVLCHLANQIRPRSVASIHVPSPAVPKLTQAKCRRNVENFLDACRKIGVDQEQMCLAPDIMEERGVQRLALTVSALVAVGTNPRQSAV